jgi:valyl-tRNA synthetase
MNARFPEAADPSSGIETDSEAEAQMALVMGVIAGIRNIRGEMNLAPSLQLTAEFQSPDGRIRKTVEEHREIVADLARLDTFTVKSPGEKPKASATAVLDNAIVNVSLEGVIDFSKEQQRLEKEIGKLAADLKAVNKKLSNEDFLDKAPAAVVEKARGRQQVLDERRQKLTADLDRLKQMQV